MIPLVLLDRMIELLECWDIREYDQVNIPRGTVQASAQVGPVFHEKRSSIPQVGPLHKTR